MNRTICCFLIILIATLSVVAEVPIVQRVEDAIRAAEPEWRCIHVILNSPPPDVPNEKLLIASVWKHGSGFGNNESVNFKMFQVDSREDAKTELTSMREGKGSPGWTFTPYSLGDEAYLATFRDGSRYEIHFRKDKIIVRIGSDSLRLAERFAKDAEGQI